MQNYNSRVYALSMLSGSLDSQLAVRILQAQGVVVHGVVFESPFCNARAARQAADHLDIHLHVIDYSQDIVSIIQQGTLDASGSYSPCRQNHCRMMRCALDVMRDIDFQFIATGEVLNQREAVQSADALSSIERDAGAHGQVVRPLSAKLLPESYPEQKGWVSREGMLDLIGRGHKRQRKLARDYGVTHFPNPTGCCRLVEPTFNERLDDLVANGGLEGVRSLALLRYGRHFRLSRNTKVIVGRNEKDNLYLEGNAELYDLLLKVEKSPGPTALLPFSADDAEILKGAAICARYSDAPPSGEIAVRIRSSTGIRRVMAVPATPEQAEALRIGR